MIEFERRFLVDAEYLPTVQKLANSVSLIGQGYVCADENAVVRIRRTRSSPLAPTEWFLTIKKDTGEKGKNFEFEYKVADAEPLFESITKKITKSRYFVPLHHLTIEVDVFAERHSGLIIAEVELNSEHDSQFLSRHLPNWFGKEITGVKEWSNYALCTKA